MILIVQCVFCATSEQLHSALSSLQSMEQIIKSQKDKFLIHLEGWFKTNDLYNSYKQYVNKINLNISLKRNGINLGKAYILNKISVPTDVKYILYMDGDLKIKNVPFLSERLKSMQEKVGGLIVLNQTGDNRHNMSVYVNSLRMSGYQNFLETMYNPNNGIGVAGGAFFISKCLYERRRYPMLTIHAIDDMIWIKQLIECECEVMIIHDICVEHPFENNKKYFEWKISNRKRALNKIFDWNEYIKQINESHLYWG